MNKATDIGPVDAAAIRTPGGKVRLRLLFNVEQLEALLAVARGDDETVKRDETTCNACNAPEESREEVDDGGDARASAEQIIFDCWSKQWWAALLARVDRGESIAFWMKHAKDRGGAWSERAYLMPSDEVVAGLQQYPSDSPQVAAWRPWFDALDAALPYWRNRVWVFLPAPEPPPNGASALPQPQMTNAL